MRRLSLISVMFMAAATCFAQERAVIGEGTISYLSASNAYIKFADTELIPVGDTLFLKAGPGMIPASVVIQKSSISCVTIWIGKSDPAIGMIVYALEPAMQTPPVEPQPKAEAVDTISVTPHPGPAVRDLIDAEDDLETNPEWKEKLVGRISAASYSTFSDDAPRHRMRYGLSFRGNHIKGSRWSTETFITFRHNDGEWSEVQENLFNALKIYSLAVQYEPTRNSILTLGRKINPRISSMGVIDGLQYEQSFGAFQMGFMAGSRPDFQDYSIDPSLFQAGAYLGYATQKEGRSQQNTLAFIEQRNSGQVDRRFVYFQHTDNLLKNLNVFASCEMDLYQKVNEEISNTPTLTNFFTSLRYRFSRTLSASVSYDNRKNVIFFESYKSYIDQLIDEETRQGLRASVNYRIFKRISLGVNTSWRFQKNNSNTSRNINGYMTFSRVPWIKGNATLTVNTLETSYQQSRYYGCRYTRNFFKGKLNGDLYYRWVDYMPVYSEINTHQDIAGLSLSWRMTRKLSLYTYFEETFDPRYASVSRFNTKLIYRL
ncbi:MAG: hypothetical protein K9I85_09525 [Saprospiraceae bacterium]|nr:hypothetical protein [Saprospiraceae bacterium]